jgi:hypothetical protein
VKLRDRFVGRMACRMFVDTGDIRLALDAQIPLRSLPETFRIL